MISAEQYIKKILGIVVFLILQWIVCDLSVAQSSFVIRVSDLNGLPVSAVTVQGNNGFGINITDGQGQLTVPSNINSPTLVFSGLSKRYVPSQIKVDLNNCPGYVCQIVARNDGTPSEVIQYRLVSSSGAPASGIPVMLLRGVNSCITPQYSDSDGLVLFAAPKHLSSCNDRDSNISNDPYTILPLSPTGQSCTFSTTITNKYNVCLNNGPVVASAIANCSSFSSNPSNSPVTYTLKLLNRNTGAGLSGANIMINNSGGTATTDGTGTARISLNGSVDYTAVVSGTKIETQPWFVISPSTCPNRICTWYGAIRDYGMSSISVNVTKDSGGALSAANIDFQNFCGEKHTEVTDTMGVALYSSVQVPSCIDSSSMLSFIPSYSGYDFSMNGGNSFLFCPSNASNSLSLVASASTGTPANQVSISGTVYTLQGVPYSGVSIFNNNTFATSTDGSGSYIVGVNKGATVNLKPYIAGTTLQFDPQEQQVVAINQNSKIDFYAVAPDPSAGQLPPDTSPCPVKDFNIISGTVYSIEGNPVPNAMIVKNFGTPIFTDSNGKYQISVQQGSDNWVSVFNGNWEFQPVAHSIPDIRCDKFDGDFVQIGKTEYVISGYITDSNDAPLQGVSLSLITDSGLNFSAVSKEDGSYSFDSVPEGESFNVTISDSILSSAFSPPNVTGVADHDNYSAHFKKLAPTPTPTSTFTYTSTPTITPTYTYTMTPTRTFTPTITLTPTKTPTFTSTATNTPTFTSTLTPTRTVTSTFTATPTITLTPVRTSTPTSTLTVTPTHTQTLTSTPTVIGTYTPSATPTPIFTATLTPNITSTVINTVPQLPIMTPTRTPTLTSTLTITPRLMPTIASTSTPIPSSTPTMSPGSNLPSMTEYNLGGKDGVGLSMVPYGNDPSLMNIYMSHYGRDGTLRFTYPTVTGFKTEIVAQGTYDAAYSYSNRTALVFDSNGNPNIIYFDSLTQSIKRAIKSAGVWSFDTIAASGKTPNATSCGSTICVCYKSTNESAAAFAKLNGKTWATQLVQDNANDLGNYCDIQSDGTKTWIIHRDNTTNQLYLSQNENGSWVSEMPTTAVVREFPQLIRTQSGELRLVAHLGVDDATDGTLGVFARSAQGVWRTVGDRSMDRYRGGFPAVAEINSGDFVYAYRYQLYSAVVGVVGVNTLERKADNSFSNIQQYLYNSSCVGTRDFHKVVKDNNGQIYFAFHYINGCSGDTYDGIKLYASTASLPTPAPTVTNTPTNTPSRTPTSIVTNTIAPTFTSTPSNTPTPSRTPSPTFTPIRTYTPLPTASFTPTAAPTATNTPTKTATPTATPTVAMCAFEGSIREGGKLMSQLFLDRISKAKAQVVVKNTKSKQSYNWVISFDSYHIDVPCGQTYTISLIDSSKSIDVASNPKSYTRAIKDSKPLLTGNDFGLRLAKSTSSTTKSSGGAAVK